MTGAVQRLRQLSPSERWQLAGMMLALPVIHASVGIAGYGRTKRWLERWSRTPAGQPTSNENLASARSIARLAAIAGRRGAVSATCLRQSLLVYWILRRRGLNPELKLGVRKHEGVVDAHAWVELAGQSLDVAPVRHQAFQAKNDDHRS